MPLLCWCCMRHKILLVTLSIPYNFIYLNHVLQRRVLTAMDRQTGLFPLKWGLELLLQASWTAHSSPPHLRLSHLGLSAPFCSHLVTLWATAPAHKYCYIIEKPLWELMQIIDLISGREETEMGVCVECWNRCLSMAVAAPISYPLPWHRSKETHWGTRLLSLCNRTNSAQRGLWDCQLYYGSPP